MKKALTDSLAQIRIISGKKSIGTLKDLGDQSKETKDKFKIRINSAKSPQNAFQVQVPENDQKIERELSFLQDIIQLIVDDTDLDHVNALLDTVVKELREESEIVEKYEKNKKLYRYQNTKWKNDQEEFKKKLLKCDEKIFDLENERKEVVVENDIKSQLVVKWEKARQEHTEGRFKEETAALLSRIEKVNSDYEKEIRIYNEVETFTKSEIERLEQLNIDWEQRYNQECSELDEQIKTAKVYIEKTQDQIQTLRDVFNGRNIEIESYLQRKAQMEEARRVEKLKWDSAVRIQAWWRGTMFRNGLGPYRKKKKAPKKGKSGKNK